MAILASISWSPLDPLVLAAVFICSWVFCHRIYNLWFHPLSHLPGPFFGRMSPWPSTFHALKGDRHLWIEHCFNKYGNRIRIEPNTVLFRSPTAARDIYSTKSNVKKSRFYDALMRKDSDRNTITTIDNAAHAKRRKLLNLAFTEKSLRASAVFMHKHIDRWHELLASDDGEWSAPQNFAEKADELVFDILGDICFGKSFEIKEPGENAIRLVPHAVVKTLAFIYPITKSPFLHALPWLRPRGLSALLDAIRSPPIRFYDNFVDEAVDERLRLEKASKSDPQNSKTREDMFHFIYNAKNPEEPTLTAFSDHDMIGEAKLLLVAGSDSTSVTMSGLFYYLSHYPEVLAKLRHEVTCTFPVAEAIGVGPKLSSCKYTRACIDEAMRMCPAGTSELPREVLPGGIRIDNEFYPAGTVVGTARWADGYNTEVYGRDARVFRPERWIADAHNSPEDVLRLKAVFQPFSQGPFNCAGMNFAMQELMLMVAKTVHRLEFRLAPGYEQAKGENVPLFQLKDAYISVKDGPMMQFRRRSS